MRIKHLIIFLLMASVLLAQDKRKIGIIPFTNKTGNSSSEWVSYGLEYLLHNKLSVISTFFVPDKKVFHEALQKANFGRKPMTERMISNIGRYSGVEVTVSGNYKVENGTLILNVVYSNAYKGETIFTTKFEEPLDNLFSINRKIIDQLVNLAGIRMTANEQRLVDIRITNSIPAFQKFIEAYIENEKPNGRLEKVISLFKQAIREDGKFWEAYYNLGIVYYNQGSHEKALQNFNTVIKALPKFDKPYYGRAIIHEKRENYDKAIENYETVIELNPNDYKPYYHLGKLNIKTEQYKAARKNLLKARELNPNYAPIHYELGNMYYNQQKFRNSIDHYKKATNLNNDNADYHLKLGDAYYRSQVYYSALNELKSALDLRPNDPIANFLYGITIYKQAVLEELVDAFLELLTSNGNVTQGQSDDKFDKSTGIDPVQRKQVYLDMAAAFTKAIQANPDFMEATFNLGLTYHEMQNYDKAEKYYKRTLQINSKVGRCYAKLAELYTDMDKKDLALETYHKLFYVDPAYFVHKPTLGREFQYINVFENFKSELQEKIQQNPNNLNNNLILAKILKAEGKFGKAANLLRNILANHPNNSEAKDLLAVVKDTLER
ncbi:MAG: tetratricopeptide repeat protein [Caldithrix sp.]|nr:tetratricopeptide repeat protein [Caldithrix sp.]